MRSLPVLVVRPLAALLVVLVATVAACARRVDGAVGDGDRVRRLGPSAAQPAAPPPPTSRSTTARPAGVVAHGRDRATSRPGHVHETSTDAGGMTGMHPVPSVTIKAGETLRLEPGGYHLMLEQLTQALDAGSTVGLVADVPGRGHARRDGRGARRLGAS